VDAGTLLLLRWDSPLDLWTINHYILSSLRLEVLAALTRRVRNGEATAEETMSRCEAWRRHLRSGTVSLVAEQEILDDALGLPLQIRQ
jgi:hypothetical protein